VLGTGPHLLEDREKKREVGRSYREKKRRKRKTVQAGSINVTVLFLRDNRNASSYVRGKKRKSPRKGESR